MALSPLLFLIYIIDIESHITSSIHLYADDSALYSPIYFESHSFILQEGIFKLQKCSIAWLVAFNVDNCMLVCITVIKYILHTYMHNKYNMYKVNA